MEVWGSMEALERERKRRKEEMEEGERYRKGIVEKGLLSFLMSKLGPLCKFWYTYVTFTYFFY